MKRTRDDFHEVSLISSLPYLGIIEILRGLFVQLGVHPQQVVESLDGVNSKVATFVRSSKKAQAIKEKFLKLRLKEISCRIKELKAKDWKHKWKTEFRPFALSQHIDVVPEVFRKSYRTSRRSPLYIQTENAFGSGLHETTQFMAWLIERCRGKFESFLDVGTGTGLLSLVALKNCAKEVVGVDMDPLCLRTAKANLQRNGYAFKKSQVVDIGEFKDTSQYDFVAANLITQDLIRLRRRIVSLVKPGKYLAISGIMEENLEALQKSYRSLPLRCLKILQGKQWVALLFKRNS